MTNPGYTDPPVDGEHEALIRLEAIADWANHAHRGRCEVRVAVDAITGLVAAAQGFLL